MEKLTVLTSLILIITGVPLRAANSRNWFLLSSFWPSGIEAAWLSSLVSEDPSK